MKLALNGQQLSSTHDLPALLNVLDAFDVPALEIWPANLPGGKTEEERERYETKEVEFAADLLRRRGIKVACVTLGFWAAPICIARGGVGALTDALRGAVDAAVKFDSGLVNCYSTGLPLTLFRAAVAPAAAYAAERGVVITLENEAHDESALPEAVAGLVTAVNSAAFATQFDPCNYYHAGVEPFPAAYRTLRRHIRYVHLKGGCHYNPAQAGIFKGSTMRNSDRDFIGYLPLRDAAFPVEAIVNHLKQDGYNGYITLEPHVPAEQVVNFYRLEVPYLRALIQRD